MTPLASALVAMRHYMTPDVVARIDEDMRGAQFFDCTALNDIFEARIGAGGSENAILELSDGHLPAPECWLEFAGNYAVALLSDLEPGYQVGVSVYIIDAEGYDPLSTKPVEFHVLSGLITADGCLEIPPSANGVDFSPQECRRAVERAILYAWMCIEAMQTPGLTHEVLQIPSRQVRRAAARAGHPAPEFRVVSLGRDPSARTSANLRESGYSQKLHYRRGHKLRAARFKKKWRKGCWAGSIENGLILHDYSVIGRAS